MKIGLVLSGGGARSFAQVGALLALEESGMEVVAIAANSSAAILGALYAAGHGARKVHDIVRGIDFKRFLVFEGHGGLFGHGGVEALLREHAPATFEELTIPLAVPTVDIQSAEQLVFSAGPLGPPVCASNAFPGLFVPVEFQGRYLMDGGILNNVPLDIIRTMTTAPALVVDVRLSDKSPLELERNAGFWERLGVPFIKDIPLTAEILMKAYVITQTRLIDVLYAMYPPDYVVRPELGDDFSLQDWGRFDEGVRLGYQAALEVLERARLRSAAETSLP